MPVADPIEIAMPSSPISKQTFIIGGIICTVYGLSELPTQTSSVSCLWLLHPRLGTQQRMEPIARHVISAWNERHHNSTAPRGLIAVSFDQRNHNSRLVEPLVNETWKHGNARHAQDMFSVFQGTAADTTQLITYLSGYVFPNNEHTVSEHMVLGISLGGHSAWHCILHDPRVTTAVIIIGCADYTRVMTDRARMSKLETYTKSTPPGATFVGSPDFPKALCEAVEKWDPTGLFIGHMQGNVRFQDQFRDPTEAEIAKLVPLMKSHLQGKRIMNLAGGVDKLVPYKASKPFFDWFKKALAPGGWFSTYDVYLEDMIFDGVGHTMSPDMLKEAIRFILDAHATKPTVESPKI